MGKSRRSILLINKRFQLRFTIYVCLWLAVLSFVYPFIIQNLFDTFFRYLKNDPMGPEVASLMRTKSEIMTLLVMTEAAFLVLTFIVSVFISHRIAGPLYKLRKTFEEYGRGTFRGNLKFRKMDYFPELAEDFNQMVRTLRERGQKNDELLAVAISRVEAAAGKAGSEDVRHELEPVLMALRKMQQDRSAESSASASAKSEAVS